jgi:predicted transcriptional regulator
VVHLGQLEAAAMECLWAQRRPATVRDVLEQLNQERGLAYTTVMTVLDNLHRKGMVKRQKSGRAWTYQPVAPRSDYTAELMKEALADNPDRSSALLRFVEQLPDSELAQLRCILTSSDLRPRPTDPEGTLGAPLGGSSPG